MQKSWPIVCLSNFLIAALMGLVLRLAQVVPLKVEYSNLLHAHSHTAMLGWAYLMIFGLSVLAYVPPESRKSFARLFWLTQLSVIGMMFAFPVQGYAAVSIAFSTLHILCSYAFAFKIWKFARQDQMFMTALILMILSTLGAWSLGIVSAFLGKESIWYKLAIQFFLHFQFNGWFLIASVAMLMRYCADAGTLTTKRRLRWLTVLFASAAVMTMGLPLGWHFPGFGPTVMNLAGSAIQILAVALIVPMVFHGWRRRKRSSSLKWLLVLAIVSLLLKSGIQMLTVVPEFADASLKIRHLAIGFIHLAMLGAVSGLLLFLLARCHNGITVSRWWKPGVLIFTVGFFATEALLFFQGSLDFVRWAPMEFFAHTMLFATAFIIAGLGMILISAIVSRHDFRHRLDYDQSRNLP